MCHDPAIWSDHARQVTRRAAGLAEMPTDESRLLLAVEPAAALYARNKLAGAGIDREGARFLVVEAGGGTVDLTAYEVDKDGRLSEVVTADGGRFVAEYVNSAFRTRIRQRRLDDAAGSGGATRLTRLETQLPGLQLQLLRSFEKLKVTFDPASADPARISMPTRLDRALDDKTRDAEDFIPTEAKQRSVLFELYRTTDPNPRYVNEAGVVPIGRPAISLPSSVLQLPRSRQPDMVNHDDGSASPVQHVADRLTSK
ncbi:MAG: hypothetical protein ABW215_18665 [Kibdelosporangium sp.]